MVFYDMAQIISCTFVPDMNGKRKAEDDEDEEESAKKQKTDDGDEEEETPGERGAAEFLEKFLNSKKKKTPKGLL